MAVARWDFSCFVALSHNVSRVSHRSSIRSLSRRSAASVHRGGLSATRTAGDAFPLCALGRECRRYMDETYLIPLLPCRGGNPTSVVHVAYLIPLN